MLTKKESNKIIKALPVNGYRSISERMEGEYSAEWIRKVLSGSVKYNKKIVQAALELIKQEEAEIEAQKLTINLLPA